MKLVNIVKDCVYSQIAHHQNQKWCLFSNCPLARWDSGLPPYIQTTFYESFYRNHETALNVKVIVMVKVMVIVIVTTFYESFDHSHETDYNESTIWRGSPFQVISAKRNAGQGSVWASTRRLNISFLNSLKPLWIFSLQAQRYMKRTSCWLSL